MEYDGQDEFEKETEIIDKIKNCKIDVTGTGLKDPDVFLDGSRIRKLRDKMSQRAHEITPAFFDESREPEYRGFMYGNYFEELAKQNIPENIIEIERQRYQESLLAAFYGELARDIRSYFLEPEIVKEVEVTKPLNIEEYKNRLADILEGWAVNARELNAILQRTYKRDLTAWETTSQYFYDDVCSRITERQKHVFRKLRKTFRKYTLLSDKAIIRNIVRIFIAVGIEKPPFDKVFQKWEKHHTRLRKQILV